MNRRKLYRSPHGTAVTSNYGPSPKAFLVIPLAGAFFLELVNALVIKTFLTMPFMQVGGQDST